MSTKRLIQFRKAAAVETESTKPLVANGSYPIKYAAGVQNILLLFALTLPLLYDPTVLEVAGDIRATATHLAVGLSALVIIVSFAVQGSVIRVARWPLIYWFALLLAACAAVSLVSGLNVFRGIQPLKNLYAQILLATAAGLVWTNQFAQRLLWALTLPTLFLAFLGTTQYFAVSKFLAPEQHLTWQQSLLPSLMWLRESIIDPLLQYYEQTSGPGTTFVNKNLAASWTGMMVPLLLALVLTSHGRFSHACARILLAAALLLLLLCGSLATWLALAGSMASWPVLVEGNWRPVSIARYVFVLGVVALVCAGIAYLYYANFSPDFISSKSRLAYNLNSFAMVRDYWLSGIGPGAFYTAYPRYHDALIPTPIAGYDVIIRPEYAHNDFVQALAELGLVGGGLYAGIFACAIFYAFRCGRRFETNQERRTFLIGGALLTISINSLFDFPLQTPAAAGAAALLIGGTVSEYLRKVPIPDRFMNRPLNIRSRGAIALLFVVALAMTTFLVDDMRLRRANQILKEAAAQIWHGRSDEDTLRLVLLARDTYPYDSGIQEFVGQAYAMYQGTEKVPTNVRIEALENAVRFDPWGPSLLIALAETYLSLAGNSPDENARRLSLLHAERVYDHLKEVADFSHLTQTIGAKIAFFRGDICASAALFRRALQINPNYKSAAESLERLERASQVVRDGCIGARR